MRGSAMTFDAWLDVLQVMRRGNMRGGGRSPYKPLLLAAVLVRISQGKLLTPEVRLDQTTSALYRQLRAEAFPTWSFPDDPRQPFARLEGEAWTLVPDEQYASKLRALLGAGRGSSWHAIARSAKCARLPDEVHAELCGSPEARARLALLLIEKLQDSGADALGLERIAQRLAIGTSVEPDRDLVDPDENLLESALEDHLVRNWATTPFAARGVQLHTNARGEVVGQQYPARNWWIDLLGWQDAHRCWWVIELKRGRASDRVVGQVGRYIGWVDRYLTKPNEQVRGVILAREISPALESACYGLGYIETWTFDRELRVHPA